MHFELYINLKHKLTIVYDTYIVNHRFGIRGIIIVLLAIFLKAKTWKRFSLDEESDSVVNQVDQAALAVGARGTTVARLAPTGKALFDGQLVEVHAINKFIDPDRPIEVVAVDGYRIDVCEVADTRFDKPQD